jgi:hypothetical protein
MSMERVGQVPYPQHHGRDFWALALELQRESGLTPAAFCRREGISDKAFGRWKGKLSQSRQPADAPVVLVPVTVTGNRPTHGWQPIIVGESGGDLPADVSVSSGASPRADPQAASPVTAFSARVELHIHLANGRCVHAHVPAEAHGLRSVLAAVEALG